MSRLVISPHLLPDANKYGQCYLPRLSGDDVEPRLCDCPKFVPWHRGPAEYNLTTTNLLLPSHFEGVWGIPPAAGGKQDLSNSHYKPLGLSPKKASGFPWSLEAWLGFIFLIDGRLYWLA